MKNGWIRTQLSDVAAVQSGSGFPERYQGQRNCEIPFYKVSDMNIEGNEREMVCENNSITEEVRLELGASLFPKGSTIFPKIGGAIATNKKRLTTRECCVDNNVMGVIPLPGKIKSDFLFYYFLAHDLSEFANEAHLPSIKKTVVEGWPITLPVALPEQQRIVSLLDEAFAGIATATANAEKNLQNARAIFESHLQSVFTSRGKGWVEKTFEELIESNVIGLTKNSREQGEDKAWPYVKMNNITRDNRFNFSNFTCVDATDEEVSKFTLLDGDFLFNTRNSYELVGKSCLYESDSNDVVLFNNNIMRVRFRNGVDPRFVLLAFSSQTVADELNALKSGTTNVSAIYFKDLKSLVIPVPPISAQRSIAAELESLATETQRLASLYERKLAALDALKKSLLHQAFTGEL